MTDDTYATISNKDWRLLYAKINAHEAILRILIHALVGTADDPSAMFEQLRSIAMDEGDIFQVVTPDREFAEQGRLDTLRFIAETFDAVKAGRDSSAD